MKKDQVCIFFSFLIHAYRLTRMFLEDKQLLNKTAAEIMIIKEVLSYKV